METKQINEQLNILFEKLGETNTTKDMLSELRPGLYIKRGQSEVRHKSYPDDWQYFGPYENPCYVERYNGRYGDDNETHYENEEPIDITVKADFSDETRNIKGQLVKTWEEFDEEDDNVHHFYFEEYKITEV